MKHMLLSLIFVFCFCVYAESSDTEQIDLLREKYAKVLNENILLKQELEKLRPKLPEKATERNSSVKQTPLRNLSLRDVVKAWKERKKISGANSIRMARFYRELAQRFIGKPFRFGGAVVLSVRPERRKKIKVVTRADGFSKHVEFSNAVCATVLLPVTKYPRIQKVFIEKHANDLSDMRRQDHKLPRLIRVYVYAPASSKQLFESLLPGDMLRGHGTVASIKIDTVYRYSRTEHKTKKTPAVYGYSVKSGKSGFKSKRIVIRKAKREHITKKIEWDNPCIATMTICDCVVSKK